MVVRNLEKNLSGIQIAFVLFNYECNLLSTLEKPSNLGQNIAISYENLERDFLKNLFTLISYCHIILTMMMSIIESHYTPTENGNLPHSS